jgi:predicted RNA-binding Zn-ribbon protein involved in translation (DUF1610 family)
MSYEVYGTQGQGGSEHPDEAFPTLEEALAFVKTHRDDGSWGIKYPDGTWHKWHNTGPCVICGKVTYWACSDCRIDTQTTVYVCNKTECRDEHEKVCTHKSV